MYRSGICADVEVVLSDGAVLPAHKVVLCARSPVFKARFSVGMRDSYDSRVHLETCSFASGDLFLEFLYSGCLDRSRVCRPAPGDSDFDNKWRAYNSLVKELKGLADFCQVEDLSTELSGIPYLRRMMSLHRRAIGPHP
mmetsp:Transcript_75173/g.211775  ORF Transcript_75173/g.211775 Transcript_75173/m.211775 type:complete len:139 (-) Transcript_75173:6-422(-)